MCMCGNVCKDSYKGTADEFRKDHVALVRASGSSQATYGFGSADNVGRLRLELCIEPKVLLLASNAGACVCVCGGVSKT